MLSGFELYPRWVPLLVAWPAVFKLEGEVFKLIYNIYYADPKSVGSIGFIGGKERIRIPINSKHSSLEALKRYIIK